MVAMSRFFLIALGVTLFFNLAGDAYAGWKDKPMALGLGNVVTRPVDNSVSEDRLRVETQEVKSETGETKTYELHYKNDVLFETHFKLYDNQGRLLSLSVNKGQSGTSTLVEYFPNGKISIEKYYKRGLLDGPCREYFEDGTLKATYQYRAGRKNGLAREYFENGDLRLEAEYVDDVLSGNYKEFFSAKKVKIQARYSKGLLNGRYQEFYANGQLKTEAWYESGAAARSRKEYSEQGVLRWEGAFVNGQLHGKMAEYDGQGRIAKVVEYKNGLKSGVTTEYFDDGAVKYTAEFYRGQLAGLERSFTADGNIIEERLIVAEQEIPLTQVYYRQGGLVLAPHGPFDSYFDEEIEDEIINEEDVLFSDIRVLD